MSGWCVVGLPRLVIPASLSLSLSLKSRFHLRTRESVSIDRDISVPVNDDSAEFAFK